MKLSYSPYTLQFRHPFGISHSTRSTTAAVYIKLEKNGKTGYGEATLPPYLEATQKSVIEFFKAAMPVLENENGNLSEVIQKIDALAPQNTSAKAAIDIALHDLFGKIENKPAYQLLNLQKPGAKETSVTIGIGDISLIPEKIKELAGFNLYKVKLGGQNDKAIISAIRKVTDKPLVVDVNQGWSDPNFAMEMIHWLAEQNVLYVEQPLSKSKNEETASLSKQSPIPLLADESFQRLEDLERISQCFSGINLKLMKCTGLLEGAKIVEEVKKKNLKINIGCMSESSCGIAAAAQLMNYADWIDLDGPMLIKNDPFAGLTFKDGKLHLPDNFIGTGAILKEQLSWH